MRIFGGLLLLLGILTMKYPKQLVGGKRLAALGNHYCGFHGHGRGHGAWMTNPSTRRIPPNMNPRNQEMVRISSTMFKEFE